MSTNNVKKREFLCESKGIILNCTEYRVKDVVAPAIIVCHGFMTSQNAVSHYAEFLAENGYIAYTFDFSSGCSYEGISNEPTTEMSVLTEIEDLKTVINYIRTLPYVSIDKLILMGRSQGAFVAALTAAKMNDIVSKIVLFCPAFCIPDEVRAGRVLKARFDPKNIPEYINCGSTTIGRRYVTDIMDMDPYKDIKPYCGDVLIVHGLADKIVDISYAEEAYHTYRNEPYNRTVQLHIIENAGHRFSKQEDELAIMYLKEFIEKQ